MIINKILVFNLKKIVFKVTFSEIRVEYIKIQYTAGCSIYTRQHQDVHKFLTVYPCSNP